MVRLLTIGRRGLRLPGVAVAFFRSGTPFCSSSAPCSVPADEEAAIYTRGNTTGKRELYGPLSVKPLPGKGRGVVSTAALELGDLLVWAAPAAVLHGPVEEQPDAALLTPQLLSLRPDSLPWGARAALEHLDDGTGAAAGTAPPPFWDPASAGALRPGSSGVSSSASSWPPRPDRIARILKMNAFGDDYEDLAAAAARGAGGRSVCGLWPGFSYFNHSCLPATVHYVVGDGMLVRAVQDVAAGDELTVSYLGREEFAPAAARRAVLHERWGFECGCERCAVEAAAPREVTQAVETGYARVMQELKPAFLEAAEAGDSTRMAAAARGLRDVELSLLAALKQHAPPGGGAHPATGAFAHAALYELFELQAAAAQLACGIDGAGGGSEAERGHAALAALSRCISIVDTVSRGAELHVFLACALLERASALRGADSPQAAAALQLVGQACEARYGKNLPAQLWDSLQRANAELAQEFL